jgi:DNA-binding NarL/FixJ family response regulator
VRVVLAEDHPLTLEAMLRRLAGAPGIEVVAVARDGEELVALWERHHPDLVVTDHEMPRLSGLEAARTILRRDPSARVVVLSAYEDPALIAALVRAGVAGFLVKHLTGPDFVDRIRAAAAGQPVFDDRAMAVMFHEIRRAHEINAVLSQREREVLDLIALGLSNAQIASRLFIGTQTVKTHVTNLCRKLHVTSRAAAVKQATQLGLL